MESRAKTPENSEREQSSRALSLSRPKGPGLWGGQWWHSYPIAGLGEESFVGCEGQGHAGPEAESRGQAPASPELQTLFVPGDPLPITHQDLGVPAVAASLPCPCQAPRWHL